MASLFDRLQARRLHPRPLLRRRSPLRPLLSCVLAGALWSLVLLVTANEPVPGRSLESIRTWVLEHNPELRAMDFEAQAAELGRVTWRERVCQCGDASGVAGTLIKKNNDT